MRPLTGMIARFGRDESGVFAVIFGLMAIVLVALGGAVVDYVALEQTRNRAQVALDAAALALQPQIFNATVTKDDIKREAEALMLDRIGDAWSVQAKVSGITINQENGSLYLRAEMTMPTIFVRLVGVETLTAEVQSEARRKKLALEVALVLDNSGSMDYTGTGPNGTRKRMQFLKDATKCAVNILFFSDVVDDPSNLDTCVPVAGAKQVENVHVGIVPFTLAVNVGTNNNTANWLDTGGLSPVSSNNFFNVDTNLTAYNGPVKRLELFNKLATERWRGCVETRPHTATQSGNGNRYLDTDDTVPNIANPSTLFVPFFAPDFVDAWGNAQNYLVDNPTPACNYAGTCSYAQAQNTCTSTTYGSCNSTTYSSTITGPRAAVSNTCTCPTTGSPTTTTTSESGNGSNKRYSRTRTWTCAVSYQADISSMTDQQKHERICKYTGAAVTNPDTNGPNSECGNVPILPLSSNPVIVQAKITAMVAKGGTNIHEGSAWGFRVLSPTAPFTEGEPYSEATSKVMIVMTDGENTFYDLDGYAGNTSRPLNGAAIYSAYGWPRNGRLGSVASTNAQLVQEINNRTRQTCENAKAQGITIYTIGLATSAALQSTQAEVEDMLADCASTRDKAYFPATPGQLKTVFQAIANDLSALRLAM